MNQRQTLNALFSAGLGKRGRMGAWAVAIVGAVRACPAMQQGPQFYRNDSGVWMYVENQNKAKIAQHEAAVLERKLFSQSEADTWNADAKKRQHEQQKPT